MPRIGRRALLAAALVAAAAGRAGAQPLDRPYALAVGPVALGGDVSAVIGPADDTHFFNYTDYELNGLRLARVRLDAAWRPHPALALLAELRTENLAHLDAAALYLRWQPWPDRGLFIQAGRVPPVVGAFPRRAYGRDNPLAGVPLVYQYLTSLRPDALPGAVDDLLRMRGRGWRPIYPVGAADVAPGIPLVNAARWDTGVQAGWQAARWEAAAAITRGAPAVPMVVDTNDGLQLSGRAALRLAGGLIAGGSAARGAWIDDRALAAIGRPGDEAQQLVWGLDVEYGSGPWLLRGEWLHSRFDLPLATGTSAWTKLDAHGGFAEIRYRPAARWQLAGRLESLGFGSIRTAGALSARWEHPVRRVEGTVGYRLTRQLDVRVGWQHNWRDDGRGTDRGYPTAQFLLWF
jgi:hypothetical protein